MKVTTVVVRRVLVLRGTSVYQSLGWLEIRQPFHESKNS